MIRPLHEEHNPPLRCVVRRFQTSDMRRRVDRVETSGDGAAQRPGSARSPVLTRPSLLLRIRDATDHEAWREFVAIYTPLIFGFARRRGLQEADAADLAQDVMRAVAQAIKRFDYQPELGTFRSWLFTITRNKFNGLLDRQRREPRGTGETAVQQFLEAVPCPERDDHWDREYHQRLFEWACQQVRGEFQEATWQAFWLTAIEDRPGQEAAAAAGLSVGAVYVARSRVTARIREKVSEITDELFAAISRRPARPPTPES